MDALVDALCAGWQRQQAEALARAEAEVGPEAAPERARELLRAESYREVPHAAPGPQVQTGIAPRADAQLEARPAQAEAQPELEIG